MDRRMTKSLTVLHCSSCDGFREVDNFMEWLPILEAGSKMEVSETQPYLELKSIQRELDCRNCLGMNIWGTVTMVVFSWNTYYN